MCRFAGRHVEEGMERFDQVASERRNCAIFNGDEVGKERVVRSAHQGVGSTRERFVPFGKVLQGVFHRSGKFMHFGNLHRAADAS
jgi:hypothetical protein